MKKKWGFWFKYKPSGQWIEFYDHLGKWMCTLEDEPPKDTNFIYEYINEIIADLGCKIDDIELIYKQDEDNKLLIKHLNSLIKSLDKRKIHYSTMVSWNRQGCEGYNEGIRECMNIIQRKIKRLSK